MHTPECIRHAHMDAAGQWRGAIGDAGRLTAAAELAAIFGTTELAPSVDFETHDVRQLGAAVRVDWDARRWGVVLDGVFASGDQNFDDNEQNAFEADVNFHQGLLLHRYVRGAWSARSAVTAADPTLVGEPAEDLDRLPTGGAVSDVVSLFGRGWVRPADGLEIYGGPLLAWRAAGAADPFNTRLAGGDPRNALDGDPGGYLATELDLGVRWRGVFSGVELVVGAEGGVLLPGPGMRAGEGVSFTTVAGGRGIVSVRM
jgi:hypothetical protein